MSNRIVITSWIIVAIGLLGYGTSIAVSSMLGIWRQAPPVYAAPDRTVLRQAVELEFERQLSLRMARSQYPDLAYPHSALSEAYAAREQALEDNGGPLLSDGDYPLELVEQEAQRLGIEPVAPVVWKR